MEKERFETKSKVFDGSPVGATFGLRGRLAAGFLALAAAPSAGTSPSTASPSRAFLAAEVFFLLRRLALLLSPLTSSVTPSAADSPAVSPPSSPCSLRGRRARAYIFV